MALATHGTTNNYGHVAPFDYRAKSHPVIVVGDSYVESLMNPYEDTVQGQLGERLGTRESVYGLGFSGLSVSDYLALSQLAGREFAPSAAVFVIFNGDVSESLLARLGYYHFVPEHDSFRLAYLPIEDHRPMKSLRKTITGLPLYRYIFGNLGFSFDTIFDNDRGGSRPAPERSADDSAVQLRVVDHFLKELPAALDLPPRCIVLLFDSDRYAIYNPKLATEPKESPAVRRHFLDRAQELGFAVSDLDVVFRARYARDRTKFDYWPLDRHWNRTGHGVAADEAYRLLAGGGNLECLPGSH